MEKAREKRKVITIRLFYSFGKKLKQQLYNAWAEERGIRKMSGNGTEQKISHGQTTLRCPLDVAYHRNTILLLERRPGTTVASNEHRAGWFYRKENKNERKQIPSPLRVYSIVTCSEYLTIHHLNTVNYESFIFAISPTS